MNGTPRLRSAFPDTPQSSRRRDAGSSRSGSSPAFTASSSGRERVKSPASAPKPAPATEPENSAPLIPFETIDAASQRLYVATFYVALWAWRLYDFYNLVVDDTESFWLFLKWLAIDGLFLFGLPSLRIPWLEWSNPIMAALFAVHAIVNGMLMFKVGIPFSSWLIALTKLLYDKEMAISERRVSPNEIVQNASLILGRQVIHILPEGSAMLNPAGESFCLDGTKSQVLLPIQINQTTPIAIDLLRVDYNTAEEEHIPISASVARKLKKEATKALKSGDTTSPVILRFPVKKPGYYVLQRVVDESKLDVQPRRSFAVVVSCPSARVRPTGPNRCRSDLSDIGLEVTGTPPLKLHYRKYVNEEAAQRSTFQSIQPDEFVSALSKQQALGIVSRTKEVDVSWAISQTVGVPLNETLHRGGLWTYEIEEVEDGLGNKISYNRFFDDNEKSKIASLDLQRSFFVHDRPVIRMQGCDPQHPVRVASGQNTALPIRYESTASGKRPIEGSHTIRYTYTPEQDIPDSGGQVTLPEQFTVKNTHSAHQVSKPGLYTLQSISSEFCAGEVEEPSACIVQNPPQPDLSIETEDITDKCARKPIGKKVYLNLIGTPPFKVFFSSEREDRRGAQVHVETIHGHAGEITLQPREAGSYEYHFYEVSDAVYQTQSLRSKDLRVRQTVAPPPYAHLEYAGGVTQSCNGEALSFKVYLQGEGPWDLEYELVHGGKRSSQALKGVQDREATITTSKLTSGGDYTLNLKSVTDRSSCKEFLKEELKIRVRHQRPKAAFAAIDGKHSVRALEGENKKLPVRLTGEAPWTIAYGYAPVREQKLEERTITIHKANGAIDVAHAGIYQLLDVSDSVCHGTVDESTKTFEVSWVDRPSLHFAESDALKSAGNNKFVKQAVCEGDDDTLDLSFSGAPPFKVTYEEHRRPTAGAKSMRKRDLSGSLGLASIPMEASQAGVYEYRFSELSDYNYRHSPKHHHPFTVEQTVLSRPTARFLRPGKTYTYCATDHDDTAASDVVETIPVRLTGNAPFSIEVELRHHSAARPEIISIPYIPGHSYDLRIPHRHLHLGSSALVIRKVRDARGCRSAPLPSGLTPQSKIPQAERVLIAVHSAPSISPLEPQTDYCVGDHVSFSLSGQPPFSVTYTFSEVSRRATSPSTTFRRLAERPGTFVVTSISDSASSCRAPVIDPASQSLLKQIHPLPAVRVSQGRDSVVDIHEGGEAEILFEFDGTPPFEFTWTRSSVGRKVVVLETRTATTEAHVYRLAATEEGSYEVVAVRDKWCGVSRIGGRGGKAKAEKLLLTH